MVKLSNAESRSPARCRPEGTAAPHSPALLALPRTAPSSPAHGAGGTAAPGYGRVTASGSPRLLVSFFYFLFLIFRR